MRLTGVVVVIASGAIACSIAGSSSSKKRAAATCGSDDECASSFCDMSCNHDLCDPGYCSGTTCSCGSGSQCAMAASPSCNAGWVCDYKQPTHDCDILGICSDTPGGNFCKPTCGSCPLNMHCDPDQTSNLCQPGSAPPQVTITATTAQSWPGVPASRVLIVPSGASVAFHGDVVAPGMVMQTFWDFADGGMGSGLDITHTFTAMPTSPPQQDAALLTVIDSLNGHGSASLLIQPCFPAGSTIPQFACNQCCPGTSFCQDSGSQTTCMP